MLAAELIQTAVTPLKLSDTVQKGLSRMVEFHLSHLPLVDGKSYLGMLSEEHLSDYADSSKSIKDLPLNLSTFAVFEDQHVYEVLKLAHEQQIDLVPVLKHDKKYKGLITRSALISALAALSSASQPGSVILLEIGNRDNSLAHIAQIVESDQAQILSSQVRSFAHSTRLEVSLKLNRTDVAGIISAFQRYNYTVLGVFNDDHAGNDHPDHYDHLMNYLDI